MNKYDILKQEYAVKRISSSEAEAVAEIMAKADLNYDVEEWVWTGNTGALLKNYPQLPQAQMGQTPESMAMHQQGGYAPVQSHSQPGGMFGMMPAKHTMYDPTGGNTMSGTRAQMQRQARATPEGSPQRAMYQQQFGEIKPSAGRRLMSALGSAGRFMGRKAGDAGRFARDKAAPAMMAAGRGAMDRGAAAFAGADAGLEAGMTGVKNFGRNLMGGIRNIGTQARNAARAEMDRRQNMPERRQGSLSDQVAALAAQEQPDAMEAMSMGQEPTPVAPPATQPASQPAPTPVAPPTGDDWGITDENWGEQQEPTPVAPPASQEPTPVAPPVEPPTTPRQTGQVAVGSGHYGPLKEGSAPAKQWMASQTGDPQDPMSGWESAHAANQALIDMKAGKPFDPNIHKPGKGFGQRSYERGAKQKGMYGQDIRASMDAHKIAWDALLKGL
jgi:hypothetical protein